MQHTSSAHICVTGGAEAKPTLCLRTTRRHCRGRDRWCDPRSPKSSTLEGTNKTLQPCAEYMPFECLAHLNLCTILATLTMGYFLDGVPQSEAKLPSILRNDPGTACVDGCNVRTSLTQLTIKSSSQLTKRRRVALVQPGFRKAGPTSPEGHLVERVE